MSSPMYTPGSPSEALPSPECRKIPELNLEDIVVVEKKAKKWGAWTVQEPNTTGYIIGPGRKNLKEICRKILERYPDSSPYVDPKGRMFLISAYGMDAIEYAIEQLNELE